MAEIGFLGLGSMGSALARRLVGGGHRVSVWNRSPAAVEALVTGGAEAAASPSDALARPVSFSMLADDEAALAVLSDTAVAASAGGIHVNMASISPAAAGALQQRFSAADARYVAAPVLGRPSVAAQGALNILAAGSDADIDAVEPLLQVLGSRVWRFGDDPAQANAVKIAVNYGIIHAIQSLGESIALVEARGVDAAEFVDLLTSTLFGGVVYGVYGGLIARREYDPPGFEMALGYKDLRLSEQIAGDSGVTLPTLPTLKAVFQRALAETDLARADWGAAAEVTRRGLAITHENGSSEGAGS